jgi:hypothetical protein
MTMQPNRGPWVDVHAHPGRCFPGGHSHDRRPARASGGDENGIGSLSDSRFVGLRLRSKRRFRRVVATVEGRTGSNIWTLPMRFEKLRRMKLFAGGIVAMILLSGCFDNNGCSQRRGPEPLIAFLGGKEFSTAPFVKELTTNGDLDCNTQSDGTSVAVRLQGESSRVTAWLLSHRWVRSREGDSSEVWRSMDDPTMQILWAVAYKEMLVSYQPLVLDDLLPSTETAR